MKKMFEVVEGERHDCGAIEWACPFCDGQGNTRYLVPEYFAVWCEQKETYFLVHHEPQTPPRSPDTRPGPLYYTTSDVEVPRHFLATAEMFAVMATAVLRNTNKKGRSLGVELGYEALKSIREKVIAQGFAKDVGIAAVLAMVDYFVSDFREFDHKNQDEIVRKLLESVDGDKTT